MKPSAHDVPGIAVADLVGILTGSGLRLASKPTELRLPLTSPTLFDAVTPPAGPRSGILLGIGLHPGSSQAMDAIGSAAHQGFGAIVLKSLSVSLDALATRADVEGIALLIVDDEIDWRQLDALITSALGSKSANSDSFVAPAVGDLFALANAVAAMVGGATAIEDLQERVLAYSTLASQPIDDDRREGILGRQVPDLPENAAQYASVFEADGAIRVPGVAPAFGRLAVAVRAGAQPLGSIWVVDATDDLDPDAESALEDAARIAALHMLRARSSTDLARAQRAELLRRLLEGGEASHLVADELGVSASGPFLVLAFQPQSGSSVDEARIVRLADLVSVYCESHQHGAECVVVGTTIYALFTGPVAADLGAAQSVADRLVGRASVALQIPVRAAVGSPAPTVGAISRSRQDADLVLLLLATRLTPKLVASARDVRSQLALLELARIFRKTPRLLSPQARAILASDEQHGTGYAETLRVYLDSSRDSAVTAERLSLHQNTLRYRLRRAEDLFGIDLGNADETLMLWLSLRVLEFD
ncbi:MAG: hypothetical protein JWQ59_1677 [Cryobacterium sp.]|nr:hypothetical protein [Cryobacterium sp.]